MLEVHPLEYNSKFFLEKNGRGNLCFCGKRVRVYKPEQG
jgi:hypothetical protein